MTKVTLGVEGMVCSMCEAHINEAVLRAFPGAKKVSSSKGKKETVVILDGTPDEAALRKAVDDTGCRVVSYQEEPWEKKGLLARLTGG